MFKTKFKNHKCMQDHIIVFYLNNRNLKIYKRIQNYTVGI